MDGHGTHSLTKGFKQRAASKNELKISSDIQSKNLPSPWNLPSLTMERGLHLASRVAIRVVIRVVIRVAIAIRNPETLLNGGCDKGFDKGCD